MAKKTVPAPSPLTFDLPVSLLAKVELQRKQLGLSSTSAVVRQALESFDLTQFASKAEERRQISVRLAFADKALLMKAAKKQNVSLGEILRAALEALPNQKLPEKKAPVPKAVEPKAAPLQKAGDKAAAVKKLPATTRKR